MKKLIIDTDCGIDDAIAIMMAISREDVDVVGITTVSGNTYVDQVTDNVLRLLSYFGRKDIPVFKGATVPLIQELSRGEKIHGENGLGGVLLPETDKKEETIKAPDAIFKLAKENEGLIVITLGPLTNVAMAINLYPELKNLIKEVVSMGGALERGNVTRFAEFNFYQDPEAVQFVINSGIPMTVVPWDPIANSMFLENELKEFVDESSSAGKLLLDLVQTPMNFIEKFYGVRGVVFPDPMTVAYVLDEKVGKNVILGDLRMELNYTTLRGASILVEG
ncbi:MAG TPA: nucleoside hydrolase, partial [Candidatus Aerophobetes bacterium]|nr:nucleoside hydrolase [Candidatus Aerophobetes bacterium]